jgi:hypothetical protein
VSNLTRIVAAAKLAAKAYAPTIMVVSGVASMGASVVVASKKTLQLEEVLEPHVVMLETIKETQTKGLPSYTDKSAAQDRTVVYGRAIVACSKHYFVAGILFTGGAALVFGGHRIMLKRNATLAIAFTAVSEAFEKYRGRVREQFGSEADQIFLNGSTPLYEVDPKTGETVMITESRDWDTENDPYNKVFSQETSPNRWLDDLGANKLFVHNQQRMANIALGLKNYLYLNDVYESLGMQKTDIGQVVGWKVKRLPDGSRDIPFVDFGLDNPHPDDWKYNAENEIYLDFNCSGLIVGGRVQKALERA